MEQKNYAVLTGDIVKSRDLSVDQLKSLQDRLKSAAVDFEEVFSDTIVGKLGITRGDGWQVVLQKPEYALRLALFIRAVVKSEFKTDTRVSIGIGTVNRLEKDNIIESTGMAFELSGHGLEMLPGNRRIELWAEPDDSRDKLIVKLLDCLIRKWTVKEAEALTGVLIKLTHDEVAERSPVSERSGKKPTRQAVGDALSRASWPEIQSCMNFYEEAGWQA